MERSNLAILFCLPTVLPRTRATVVDAMPAGGAILVPREAKGTNSSHPTGWNSAKHLSELNRYDST